MAKNVTVGDSCLVVWCTASAYINPKVRRAAAETYGWVWSAMSASNTVSSSNDSRVTVRTHVCQPQVRSAGTVMASCNGGEADYGVAEAPTYWSPLPRVSVSITNDVILHRHPSIAVESRCCMVHAGAAVPGHGGSGSRTPSRRRFPLVLVMTHALMKVCCSVVCPLLGTCATPACAVS